MESKSTVANLPSSTQKNNLYPTGQQGIGASKQPDKAQSFSSLKKRYGVSHETKHPAPKPVIRISEAYYGLQGMISALTGPPKSGKTTVIGFMIATTLTAFANSTESLSIQSSLADNRDVVYLDFEQHVSSTQDLHDKVLRYANLSQCPENLHILSLLELTTEERLQAVRDTFHDLDPHLIILDGLADLLPSVNDEEKANALIEELALMASRHNTCLVVVIHENKGGGSVRGHLGSQIERKCAGLISIRKDRETKTHSIESRLIRIGDDFDNVYFRYSEDLNRMVLLDAVSTEEHNKRLTQKKAGKDKDPEFLGGLLKLCFKETTFLNKADLQAAICKYDKDAGSDKTANRRIQGAIELGLLELEHDGEFYKRLTTMA
ncbi:hypothetical protein GCM10028808_50000 [Spirosoma migulaei]